MPLLAAFLGNLLTSLASFFALWFTKQVALRLALVAAFIALAVAAFAAIDGAFAALAMALPSELSVAVSWVVPYNAKACAAAIVATYAARWVFDFNTRMLQLKTA